MESLLLFFAVLFLCCIFLSKISDKFGIPSLFIFLGIGMLAGSDGVLGVHFSDHEVAQNIGMIALIFILYASGLDTDFNAIKPVFGRGIILATLGVVLTALAIIPIAMILLDFSFLEAFLLGAIISSTDAAAVFAILKAKKISLKNNLSPLIELESGSNDPMAIFLTLTIIQMFSLGGSSSVYDWVQTLFMQFGVGILFGYVFGVSLPGIFNRLRLEILGLYPVFSIAWVLLLYTTCYKIGGNGYLAVYIAGIFINKKEFVHKKNLIGFHDGIAWAMQIVIFLILGLLVFPSELPKVALAAFAIGIWLMLIARPIGVFISLMFSKFSLNDKLFVSWVGLRGVVPIVLATYVYGAEITHADLIFNTIFVMVLLSIFIQGMSISFAADKFRVKERLITQAQAPKTSPLFKTTLHQATLFFGSKLIGKTIVQLDLPPEFLILLIQRDKEYIKPTGSFVFAENDILLIQCDNDELYTDIIKKIIG